MRITADKRNAADCDRARAGNRTRVLIGYLAKNFFNLIFVGASRDTSARDAHAISNEQKSVAAGELIQIDLSVGDR